MKANYLKTILLLTFIMSSITAISQNIVGDWKGTLDVQGVKLGLIFHVTQKDGLYVTTLDVPMQGASGLAVDKTTLEGNKLVFNASALQIKYEGEVKENAIDGTFIQAGQSFPLQLTQFESKLPGNPALVTSKEDLEKLVLYDKGNFKYQVADYFAKPKASAFQISPDGKFLSYKEKDENGKMYGMLFLNENNVKNGYLNLTLE